MEKINHKWLKSSKELGHISEGMLVCRNCSYRLSNPSAAATCQKFDVKPVSILKGGVCVEYKKE